MPGTIPGMASSAIPIIRSFPVVGRTNESGALDRGVRGKVCEQPGIVICAELVLPIAVAHVSLPNAGVAPVELADVQRQPVFRENFCLGFVAAWIAADIRRRVAPPRSRLEHRSISLRYASALGEVDGREAAPGHRPREERQRLD